MKKLLFSLLMVPALAVAEDVPLGMTFTSASSNAQQTASVLYGRQLNTNTLRQIAVNSDGSLVVGAASTTITALPSYSPIGMLNYNAASSTAQTLNLTTTASASVPCIVCLSSNGGPAAGFKVQFTTSATAPVVLTSTSKGHYIAASTTAQCWGPFAPGVHLHAAGVAATSSILVDIQKVQ